MNYMKSSWLNIKRLLKIAFSNDVDDLRYEYDTIFSGEVKAR